MEKISTSQPWQQQILNQSGIRRFKIADARSILVVNEGVVPVGNIDFYEFIFPSDMSCVANIQLQHSEGGTPYWKSSITCALPNLTDEMVMWIHEHSNVLWMMIAEDYNHRTRIFGSSAKGLSLGFQATTGVAPKDTNPMNIAFTADQLVPYKILPAYEDNVLFPEGGFSYGFSTGFYS